MCAELFKLGRVHVCNHLQRGLKTLDPERQGKNLVRWFHTAGGNRTQEQGWMLDNISHCGFGIM